MKSFKIKSEIWLRKQYIDTSFFRTNFIKTFESFMNLKVNGQQVLGTVGGITTQSSRIPNSSDPSKPPKNVHPQFAVKPNDDEFCNFTEHHACPTVGPRICCVSMHIRVDRLGCCPWSVLVV